MSKTSQNHGSEDPASKVYIGEKIGKWIVLSLGGSLVLVNVLAFVCVFIGSFGPDKTSTELSYPIPVAMMVFAGIAVVCLVIIVMPSLPRLSLRTEKSNRGKGSKLPKGPNLKIAE